ncbi:hypothetical protein L1987_48753 [Smallanthus sonchifolius]|uniref:Uncharacterized protein n=1 Tax=Smallanthus sonchifolius TaxID=185202 RepID=A0ACB9FTF8_9ASTR|nr:hypothetical protein L1987_48753 [Smallanthus sonchifolius]
MRIPRSCHGIKQRKRMERWGNARPAIGGTAVEHLEQNAQAFNQISANFAAFKLTYIYTHIFVWKISTKWATSCLSGRFTHTCAMHLCISGRS